MEEAPSTATLKEAAEAIQELAQPSILDDVREFASRFIWLPDEEMDAFAAWIVHTHVFRAFYASPRLYARGPMDSGKSTVLKVATALSKNGARCSNASMPSVYTFIEQEEPTLLFDETDQWLARQSGYSSGMRRELMGILNDGYTEDAYVWRQVDHVTKKYPVYVVAGFGGIGHLSATMESRCAILNMEQKPKHVHLRQWDPKKFGAEAREINKSIAAWARSKGPELDPEPPVPSALGENRAYQIWLPLISIGDLEGKLWGTRVRAAALKMVCGISSKPRLTPAQQLILAVADNTNADGFMPTGELIQFLVALRDNGDYIPWAKWLDDPVSAARQLAALLRPHNIVSFQKWMDGENRRGYGMGDFHLWAERIRDKS
jgi:Protein of unknown function (DUF3631)